MTEPTLAMILRQAVNLCGTSEGAVRLSKADEAERARAAYAWLASQLTTCSRAAIGLYIGLPLSAIDELVADVDGQVAGNAELREVFEVHAIELMAELGVRIRLGKNYPDRAPLDVARQVMAGGATAFTTGTAHLTHMASAFVAQSAEIAERDAWIAALTADVDRLERKLADQPDPSAIDRLVKDVVTAAVEAGQARFTSAEAGAQAKLDRAVVAYSATIPRKSPKGAVQ